jgi:hypothetical protein
MAAGVLWSVIVDFRWLREARLAFAAQISLPNSRRQACENEET